MHFFASRQSIAAGGFRRAFRSVQSLHWTPTRCLVIRPSSSYLLSQRHDQTSPPTTTTTTTTEHDQHHDSKKFPFSWTWFAKGLARTCIVVGMSMGFGDFICQRLERDAQFQWNHERTKTMWLVGTFSSGPAGHIAMCGLEYIFPGRSTRSIIFKVLGNSVWALVFSIPLLFTSVTLFNGKPLSDAKRKIDADLIPTFLAGGLYWPLVNFFNFKLTPLDYRAIVGSFFGVLWHVYLSFKANSQDHATVSPVIALPTVDEAECESPKPSK
jgi:hypothetical protein